MYLVYGTPTCTWCSHVKELLKSRFIEYTYKELKDPKTIEEFQKMFPGAKTVPQIITNDGTKLSGYDALKEYLK